MTIITNELGPREFTKRVRETIGRVVRVTAYDHQRINELGHSIRDRQYLDIMKTEATRTAYGILIELNDDYIVVASTITQFNENVKIDEVNKILRKNVIKIETLRGENNGNRE